MLLYQARWLHVFGREHIWAQVVKFVATPYFAPLGLLLKAVWASASSGFISASSKAAWAGVQIPIFEQCLQTSFIFHLLSS
jgi:hypothetical protein